MGRFFLIGALLLLLGIGAAEMINSHKSSATKEFTCLENTVGFEAGKQSVLGQKLVANVVVHRSKFKRFGGPICGVVNLRAHGVQFSWILLPEEQLKRYKAQHAQEWLQVTESARAVYEGEFTPPPEFKEALYYMNPTTASRHAKCWFEKSLIEVGVEGDHHFYREAVKEGDSNIIELQPKPDCGKMASKS